MKVFPAVGAAILLSACTTSGVPDVEGGPPRTLDPAVAATLSVGHIRVDAIPAVYREYLEAKEPDSREQRDPLREMEFASTVQDELREELSRCATGGRMVDMTVLVTERRTDPRVRSLLDGNGADTMVAVVEVVEPGEGRGVLGRYAIEVGVRSGNLLERIWADSLMATAEMMGREVCLQVFGRNPRPPSLLNATGD